MGVPIDPFGQRVSLVAKQVNLLASYVGLLDFRVFKWIRRHLTGMAFGFAYALPSFVL